jgi:hypothetical protein
MLDTVTDANTTAFSHVKPGDTPFRGDGLRDFFLYRDLGVAAAVGPADFTSIDVPPVCEIPATKGWGL